MRLGTPLLVGFALLLGGCVGPRWAVPSSGDARVEACRAAFTTVDLEVAEAGVGDAEAARIPGFPYLRASRFLASFRNQPLQPAAFEAWVDRLRRLDRQARRVELANLPPAEREKLAAPIRELAGCADVLRRHDLTADGRRALRRAARVPDHYSALSRTLGLYPFTSFGVAVGFMNWKRRFLPAAMAANGPLPVEGSLTTYRPTVGGAAPRRLRAGQVAAIVAGARDNPLGIPEPKGADLARLIETFAPVWVVDEAGPADRIGHPVWRRDGGRTRVDVDAGRPVAFTRLSHTRFGGEILLQINYQVWFRERPLTGALDLLGGWLDSVIWRVTIGADGRPLAYDSMHGCGCYHMFFPVPPTARKPMPEDLDHSEGALVAGPGPRPGPDARAAIRLTSGAHYIAAVDTIKDGGPARSYRLLPPGEIPDLALRTAPLPREAGGSRSFYGPDGLVAGSERLERFILWPMGIASPGGMRQWGTHSTAFVGRRHFDEPYLFEKSFRR